MCPDHNRIIWTLGHLLMLTGIYALVYAGGIYASIEYNRLAARGDSDFPAPRRITRSLPMSPAEHHTPAAFTVPVLTASTATNTHPAAPGRPALHMSTVERIIIPSIDVDSKVIEVGWKIQVADGRELAIWQVAEYAVGHHQGSANPGAGGNVVLAGHVGGYGKVFLNLFSVEPGDQVTLYSKGQQYLYVVQNRMMLDEAGVSAHQQAANARYIAPTNEEVVTLVTCWPPTGPEKFSQRIIVRAVPYRADTNQNEEPPNSADTWHPR